MPDEYRTYISTCIRNLDIDDMMSISIHTRKNCKFSKYNTCTYDFVIKVHLDTNMLIMLEKASSLYEFLHLTILQKKCS